MESSSFNRSENNVVGIEVILYYDKTGKKQWVIAEKGNSVVKELVKQGYKKEDFLVIDASGQIDSTVENNFGY